MRTLRILTIMEKILLLCVFVGHFTAVTAITSSRYMSDFCNSPRPVFVNDSIFFKLTNELLTDTRHVQKQCASTLLTEPSKRLIIHFISLDISIDNETPDCLHIDDFDRFGNSHVMTPVTGLFGTYDQFYKRTSSGVGDYISTSNRFRLRYVGSPTLTYSGFQLLVTSVKDSGNDDSCSRLFGKCTDKKFCVPLSVWCDGDQNCGEGDKSDEMTCNDIVTSEGKYTYVITMAVVTAVVAIFLFLTTVAVVACLLVKVNKRNSLRSMTVVVSAKRENGDWKITNDMGLTLNMAPPLYDDIIKNRQDEPPPSYETLNKAMTGTEHSTEDANSDNDNDNECITVVCIETLNPSCGLTKDIVCPLQKQNLENEAKLRCVSDSLSSKESSGSNSSLETGFVSMESDSPRFSGSEGSPSHSTGATESEVSPSHSAGFPQSEKLPSHSTGARTGDTPKIKLLGDIDENSVLINHKRQSVTLLCDEIEYIDELDEDSNAIN